MEFNEGKFEGDNSFKIMELNREITEAIQILRDNNTRREIDSANMAEKIKNTSLTPEKVSYIKKIIDSSDAIHADIEEFLRFAESKIQEIKKLNPKPDVIAYIEKTMAYIRINNGIAVERSKYFRGLMNYLNQGLIN